MAVTATFTPPSGVLSVFGDSLNNTITTSRNAAGNLLVNGGAVAIMGGTATVANTSLIQIFGQAGDDIITLNESNGALPRANLFGGAGNDTLTGGSGQRSCCSVKPATIPSSARAATTCCSAATATMC